jgi:hypothetical protein
MLDVWSNLAERYARPLDADDIIDLNTGEVIKDRGVIRGSRDWDLGCFADDVGEEEAEEGEEEEDEDDIDELDSFAPARDTQAQGPDVEADVRNVPPVREMDPADAEDLRQFLEAERRRREICGSDIEETESSVSESHDEGEYSSERVWDSVHTENADDSGLERSATPDALETATASLEISQTTLQRSATVFVESDSDDGLVSYGIDEASIVHRIPKKEELVEEESDSEVEFVEPPLPPPRPKPKAKVSKQRLEPKSPRLFKYIHSKPVQQLQTPPQSQASSFVSSVTPSDDYYIQLPPDSSPLPPSSPPSSHYSSPTKPSQHQTKGNAAQNRSSGSQFEYDISSMHIPRLDLTKVSKGKLASKSSKSQLTSSHARMQPEASGSRPTPIAEPRKLLNKEPLDQQAGLPASDSEPPAKTTRPKVEVVLKKRPPFQKSPLVQSSPQFSEDATHKKDLRRMRSFEDGRPMVKSKGKEREIALDFTHDDQLAFEEVNQSDDPITALPSSPLAPSRERARSTSRKTREPENDPPNKDPRRSHKSNDQKPALGKLQYGETLKLPSAPTITKKRKRVVSSSENSVGGFSDAMDVPSDGRTQNRVEMPKETSRHVRADTMSSNANELPVPAASEGMFENYCQCIL